MADIGARSGRWRYALPAGAGACLATAAFVLAATIAAATARPFPLPPSAPVATVEAPDEWGPTATPDGVEATANGGAVRLAVQFVAEPNPDEALRVAMAGLKSRGFLPPDLRPRRSSAPRAGNLEVALFEDANAEPEGRMTLLTLPGKAGFVAVTWWGDDEAQESVGTDLQAIVESVRPAR